MLAGFRLATNKEEKLPMYSYDFDIPKDCQFHHHLYYKFLKKNFGKPKSLSWPRRVELEKKKKRYIDDKLQWSYLIRTPQGFIAFSDRRRSYLTWSAYVVAEDQLSKEPQVIDPRPKVPMPDGLKEDIEYFFRELKKYVDSISKGDTNKIGSDSHPGVIVLNPFQIHYSNFKYHTRLLRKFQQRLTKVPYYYTYEHARELEHLGTSSFILLMVSFDGFINLLYECFLQEQLRENKGIEEKIERENIGFKIQMLPVYCTGFKSISSFEKRFRNEFDNTLKQFTELLRLRNKLVHANLFGFRQTNMIEEDTFLFYADTKEDGLYSELFGYSSRTELVIGEWKAVLANAEKTILSLIKLIFKTMHVKQRSQLKKVYHDYWVGYVITRNGVNFVRDAIY